MFASSSYAQYYYSGSTITLATAETGDLNINSLPICNDLLMCTSTIPLEGFTMSDEGFFYPSVFYITEEGYLTLLTDNSNVAFSQNTPENVEQYFNLLATAPENISYSIGFDNIEYGETFEVDGQTFSMGAPIPEPAEWAAVLGVLSACFAAAFRRRVK